MGSSTDELLARIARLEAENDALRTVVSDVAAPEPAPTRDRAGRSRWWTALATLLILIGALLAPVAIVMTWTKAQISDTDVFVGTFAPLIDDPNVQAYIADQATTAIEQSLDIPQLTNDLFDGVQGLGLPDRASVALDLLRVPAAAGVQQLLHNAVSTVVESEAFSTAWSQALRISHRQLIGALTGDEDAAIVIGPGGEIGISLGPIVSEVRSALVAQGFAFAENIPNIDRVIPVAQSDQIVTVQLLYGVAVTAGVWLPWIALLFLVAGVLVARRRLLAAIWASVALGLSAVLLGSGLAIGGKIFQASVGSFGMPARTADIIYGALVERMGDLTVTVAVLAVTVAIVTWAASPYRVPSALRQMANEWAGKLRSLGHAHGLSTGAFGRWLYRQRVLVRGFIGVTAAAVILFVRPMSATVIIWTAVIAIVLLWLSTLLQELPADAAAGDEAGDDEAADDDAGDETPDATDDGETIVVV